MTKGGGVAATLVLPPPQLAVVRTIKAAMVAKAPPNARRLGRRPISRLVARAIRKSKRTPTARAGGARRARSGVRRGAKENGAAAPLVVTITANEAGFPFEICSEDGA